MTTPEDETPADRYRRLAERFTSTVQAVPAGAWDKPSPCAGWSAAEVLAHVIDSETGLLKKAGADAPSGPTVQADPVRAWESARDAVQAALDDPECADVEYDGMGGRTTVGATFGSFMSVDLIVHRWDIAHAAGIDDSIPAQDMAFAQGFAERMGDVAQTSGAFGPRVVVSEDADEQTKFLALLGRSAR